MEYDVLGKKIVGLQGGSSEEMQIDFDDGVSVRLKAVPDVDISRGKLIVTATIELSTHKIKLKAEQAEG